MFCCGYSINNKYIYIYIYTCVWSIYPHPSWLLHCHRGNHPIDPKPVKKSWKDMDKLNRRQITINHHTQENGKNVHNSMNVVRSHNYNHTQQNTKKCIILGMSSLTSRFMGPTWDPAGADRTQVGPMLAPWTLLSGLYSYKHQHSQQSSKMWIIHGMYCIHRSNNNIRR